MDRSPIVMQTLWRTRGTYFWGLFRRNPAIRPYYEPLNEALASRTDQQWLFDFQYGGAKTLRHPEVDRHYATEYPLRPAGGVEMFRRSMAYARFMLTERDEDEALELYLRSLVDHAERHGQRAFFKFVRGGLRAGFIRRVVAGTQIYLNRPPSEILKSARSFGEGSYFIAVLVHIVLCDANRPFCAIALDRMRAAGPFDPPPRGPSFPDSVAIGRLSSALNATQAAILVTTFWLAYLLEGLAVADLVIDTERLGGDAPYRNSIAAQLAELLGPDAFRDYRSSVCPDDFVGHAAAMREILSADPRLRALAASTPARALDALGDASRRLLDAVL